MKHYLRFSIAHSNKMDQRFRNKWITDSEPEAFHDQKNIKLIVNDRRTTQSILWFMYAATLWQQFQEVIVRLALLDFIEDILKILFYSIYVLFK